MSEQTIKEEHIQATLPSEPEPSSTRLVMTLGLAGFFSGVVLVTAYLATLPMIQANKARALELAIYQVLPGSASYETLVLQDGALQKLEEGEQGTVDEDAPRVYAGFSESGERIGFAIATEEPGFQDVIGGIFGYRPEEQQIIGFAVLESKETPGLGDKIMKDAAFQENFTALAVDPAIVAVKKGEKNQANEVEAITGATISSKAIVRLLQKGMDQWRGPIEAYLRNGGELKIEN
jgi:electron transport complex protein RnfG